MRLLNIHTLEFGEFLDGNIPPYCILSHRWGETELSYRDFRKGCYRTDCPGYQKIVNFCLVVKDRQVIETFSNSELCQWVWIDTICIDKRSSAELSEAINSMFNWYKSASECFVYLNDVAAGGSEEETLQALEDSSWFYRGWTLQELLAPEFVVFFDASWEIIGHLCGYVPCSYGGLHSTYGPWIGTEISDITNIPVQCLNDLQAQDVSIAQRMSWASNRTTSRIEDEAYCLLGIFDINMPLLYGEGAKAFQRLQEEIIRRSCDQSIFAWAYPNHRYADDAPRALLALSPHEFKDSGEVRSHIDNDEQPYQITNRGLQWQNTRITITGFDNSRNRRPRDGQVWPEGPQLLHLLKLNCQVPRFAGDPESPEVPVMIALRVERTPTQSTQFYRVQTGDLGQNFEHRLRVRPTPEPDLYYLATRNDLTLAARHRPRRFRCALSPPSSTQE